MLSMASVFEISPFLNCLTTAMAAWTAAVANPAGMVYVVSVPFVKQLRRDGLTGGGCMLRHEGSDGKQSDCINANSRRWWARETTI